MQSLIANAGQLIAQYNPALAAAWNQKPFARVELAYAFAAGFASSPSDDVHPAASVVLQVALAERRQRER